MESLSMQATRVIESVYGSVEVKCDGQWIICDMDCSAECYKDALSRRGWSVKMFPATNTHSAILFVLSAGRE